MKQSRKGNCEVEECERPILAKRLCGMHYQRMTLHGSVKNPRPTVEERFWKRVYETPFGCWMWTGSTLNSGYGSFIAEGETLAHRVSYRLFKGLIPDGLHIDHLCSERLCVNPAHLEAVTMVENNRRSKERGRMRARQTPQDRNPVTGRYVTSPHRSLSLSTTRRH